MKNIVFSIGLALLFTGSLFAQAWQDIAQPTQVNIPSPLPGKVNWRTDLQAAFTEAKASNRPLLVTWRCLPCKQCAEFDKDVLDGSPSLTPLLQQYITVRMTDAAFLDERYFPYTGFQDLDLSWWGYMLSPEGRIYSVFGGKDHLSDATRISEAALVNNLKRVLNHHYDPRRENWNIDGPLPDLSAKAKTPKDLPAFRSLAEKRPHFESQSCVHCHQVADILNHGKIEAGTFDPTELAQSWPLPENVGIWLDRDHGLKVNKVSPGSPAEQIGIRAGDILVRAGDRKVFGQADFRGILHRSEKGTTQITVGWLSSANTYQENTLNLKDGWRITENFWRKSVYDGVYGEWIGFFPLKGPQQGKGHLSIKPFMGPKPKVKQNPWYAQGLRPHMEIISINGNTEDLNNRQLLTWFKINHKKGDTVTLKIKGGKEMQLRLPLQRAN